VFYLGKGHGVTVKVTPVTKTKQKTQLVLHGLECNFITLLFCGVGRLSGSDSLRIDVHY